jgi:hypothetical protein
MKRIFLILLAVACYASRCEAQAVLTPSDSTQPRNTMDSIRVQKSDSSVVGLVIDSTNRKADSVAKKKLVYYNAPSTEGIGQIRWTPSLLLQLDLSQVAFSASWTQGGENALAYKGTIIGTLEHDVLSANQLLTYKFVFGQARFQLTGLRKTDDILEITTVATFKTSAQFHPYLAETFTTQVANTYSYDALNNPTPIKALFDPWYFTPSAGVYYQPIPEFKTRIGGALRIIASRTYTAYTDDPTTSIVENSSIKGGPESYTEINWQISQNIIFTSKTLVFSPLTNMTRFVVDSDNLLLILASKIIRVTVNGRILIDPDVTASTQYREGLAIGLAYSVF